MKVYKIPSVFFGETVIFHYPARERTDKALLLLKGLYGKHAPQDTKENLSWDNQLISLLKNRYEVFIFNTGCRGEADKREAFEGKTFQNECDDTRRAFLFCTENILKEEYSWEAVAMSFGGTTLLGSPDVLHAMQNIVMIGSGCGKSPTTTKPLVSTLPDTDKLLLPIRDFTGSLYFLHGGKDAVVPAESQRKIYDSAAKCSVRGWVEFSQLDHELNNMESRGSYMAILAKKFLSVVV